MKKVTIFLALCTLFLYSIPQESQTCTTFCLDDGGQPVCGKNYDWMVEDGLVIINKRGVKKTAIPAAQQTLSPLKWTSKYGSVTFNQYGRELPMGGMNEAGLVVEAMLLDETEYPLPDSRPALLSWQWGQYQLDNFSTVEEVIASKSQIRIMASVGPGTHFLVCDKTGNSATIEFLAGNLVYHTKKTMPVKTLTNSIYSESINFWKKDKLPPFDNYRSVERFIRAATMVKNYDSETSIKANVSYSFDILKSTSQMNTQLSIVYDVEKYCIYFRTAGNPKIRHIDTKRQYFSTS